MATGQAAEGGQQAAMAMGEGWDVGDMEECSPPLRAKAKEVADQAILRVTMEQAPANVRTMLMGRQRASSSTEGTEL